MKVSEPEFSEAVGQRQQCVSRALIESDSQRGGKYFQSIDQRSQQRHQEELRHALGMELAEGEEVGKLEAARGPAN